MNVKVKKEQKVAHLFSRELSPTEIAVAGQARMEDLEINNIEATDK